MKTVAIVLAGCGRGDGSEIHESVSCLIHCARLGLGYRCFAPDKPQADVINHATGRPVPGESRNLLVEAARIARGEIAPLGGLDIDAFDGIVFPGGFGAAKNLCTFARDGAACEVEPDVARVVRGFHAAGKPMAFCCIAPVIAARVLGTSMGGPGVEVTLGRDEGAAAAVVKMGSRHVPKNVDEAHADHVNRIATSPAYMFGEANPHEVFTGIGAMLDAFVKMGR